MTLCISVIVLTLLLLCNFVNISVAIESITSTQPISDSETINSPENIFKLGFFSPGYSTNKYVGIWYSEISPRNIVWVANRNKPINDSSGILTISQDGNLVILNGKQETIWSSNVSSNGAKNSTARLQNDGNFVLINDGKIIWESFQEPCDTFLPGMVLSLNEITGKKKVLTPWKSPDDPSDGSFSAGIFPRKISEIFIWKNGKLYWRSGPWFDYSIDLNRLDVQENNGTYSAILKVADVLYNFAMSFTGESEAKYWKKKENAWQSMFQAPGKCGIYGKCGKFGICNEDESPICSCLPGFVPENEEEWKMENWTNGCVRKKN